MGRALNALMIVWIIDIVLYMFAGQTQFTSLSQLLFTSPADWSTLPLFSTFNALLAVGGTAAIVVGLYFIRNEWIVYAGLVLVTITFGYNIVRLWQIVEGSGVLGAGTVLLANFLCGGLILFYIWTMLDYARGRD